MLNIQKTEDIYCFLCILVRLRKIDTHREQVAQYKKHSSEFNMGNRQFPMRIKVIPKFEESKSLFIGFFELTSFNDFH